MKTYDLAVIGSGPGGYVAALYASRHKMNVCVIEKNLTGGTCLNKGCIPTKSLINSASILSTISEACNHGIEIDRFRIDFNKMQLRKNDVVSRLRTGIETLFRANKIDLIKGKASIMDSSRIAVDGHETVSAKNTIIACGSKVSSIPGFATDKERILSSDDILEMREVPESIAIVGGGVIGCEFASLSSLGSKVTIIEALERLIPTQSREASKKLESIFRKRGLDIRCSSKVRSVSQGANAVELTTESSVIAAQKVLVAAGRSPDTDDLADFKVIGIRTESGKIQVDNTLRTGAPNIFAIGDCVPGPMLAHKASYDGLLAVDIILGRSREVDYSNIPNCIWTDPQISSIGLTEEDAKLKYPGAKAAKFPYIASGKAFVMGKSEGYVKVVGSREGEILGVEIFGEEACELIGEASLAKTMGINIKDWAMVVHGHPTLSEILQEAAHIFCGTPIHSI